MRKEGRQRFSESKHIPTYSGAGGSIAFAHVAGFFALAGQQRAAKALHERALIERLLENAESTLLKRLAADFVRRKCGHEYGWSAGAGFEQARVKIEPAHARHSYVADQTGRTTQDPRLQEILGGRKGHCFVAMRLQKPCCRFANGLVVVDDGDHGSHARKKVPLS